MPIVVEEESGSLGTTSTRSSAKRDFSRAARSRQLAIGWSTRTLIRPSETASDTSRCARLARNAELCGDLVLGVAGDIIEPAGARRVVQPVVAAVLSGVHVAILRSARPRSLAGISPCAIVNRADATFARICHSAESSVSGRQV